MNHPAWLILAPAMAITTLLQQSLALGQNTAASEAMFQRGVAEMMQGKYASACPALQESYALEPKAGTKFALAECEAKWGHVATALAHYSDYLGLIETMPSEQKQRHLERAAVAHRQIDALNERVPMVALELPENAPAGTVVRCDGVVLGPASLANEIPVDPGKHVVVTRPPQGPEHALDFEIGLGEHKRLRLKLETSQIPPEVPDSTVSSLGPPERSPTGRSHTWSYVAGGIGLAGLAVGGVTGILSLKKKQIVDENCAGSSCNTRGVEAADAGRTLATASTVGFGVGLAGVATAVVLWITAPTVRVSEQGKSASNFVIAVDGRTATIVGMRGNW